MNAAKSHVRNGWWLIASICLCGCGVARAEDRKGGVDLQGNVRLTSDYRFRGLSYSDRKPALQGGAELQNDSGWFGGAWGSVSLGSRAGDEIDLYIGRSGQSGSLGYSLAAYAYMDRGVRGIQYAEVQALLWRNLGPVLLQLEVSSVPKQQRDVPSNLYLGATATIPLRDPRWSIHLHGGREKGIVDHKIDWEAGLAYGGAAVTLSASLVGSTHAARHSSSTGYHGGTGFVLSASTGF